ncbi:thioredoxin family protein [Sulfurovum riftiae]|uniref:Thioredoxin domain-containing protein n=1 Tax=Sulfurovum riftiae TaxID=1630136 RepID=A0A151CKA6_9BACT|nr:thioredoxin family protein [Sulfurovum riftiae]KYJ87693.1 hypothetical protein AS592_11410 [Sulfurovum riftiae]
MKLVLSLFLTLAILQAQSFFSLTDLKSYDIIVANMTSKVDKKYNKEIEAVLREMSKELGIDMKGHSSNVLALVVRNVVVDQCVGIKIDLDMGEYLPRPGSGENVFSITYMNSRIIRLDAIEDDLVDTVEEMAEKFADQYRDDNKKLTEVKAGKRVSYENFAREMAYETNYMAAMKKAKAEGKPVMVFMTTNYCPWCRKFESRILTEVEIDRQIKKKYVPLLLNFEKKEFPSILDEIAVTPTLYIIDPKTEKILHTFVGYSSREDFLRELKK